MTIQRMIELLAFERKCVESADECDRNCAECNLVQDTDELLEMYNSVIELLKAKGPRVMTLEEVEQEKVMWLEINSHEWSVMSGVHETVLRTDDDRYEFSDIIIQFINQDGCEIICARDRFGIEWRCWASRPTVEQMNNTPWEERDNGEKAE